jgi:hypothetical protein
MTHVRMPLDARALNQTFEAIRNDLLAGAEKRQIIFDVLWENRTMAMGLSTKEILEKAGARYDPQKKFGSVESVRQQIHDLKVQLDGLFLSVKGRRLSHLVRFRNSEPGKRAKGAYHLEVEDRSPLAKLFWEPYLSDRPVQIVFTQLQFFRGGENNRFFARDLDVNDDSVEALMKLRPFLADVPGLHAVRHYIGRGEVELLAVLMRWFGEVGAVCEIVPAHETARWLHPHLNQPANLILIGNTRTFPALADVLQLGGFNFSVTALGIENRSPEEHEKKEWAQGHADGVYSRTDDFDTRAQGVLCRFFDDTDDRYITALCSNHSSFFAGMADELDHRGKKMSYLLDWLLGKGDSNPQRFEGVLEFACDKREVLRKLPVKKLAKRFGAGVQTSSAQAGE